MEKWLKEAGSHAFHAGAKGFDPCTSDSNTKDKLKAIDTLLKGKNNFQHSIHLLKGSYSR